MTISKELELAQYARVLPVKESLALMLGHKYQTGSDYSDEQLAKSVEELSEFEECGVCGGRGWTIYNTSIDGDKDECHCCEGRGCFLPLEIDAQEARLKKAFSN